MALTAGSTITSSDITTLKNRVKAEMARRSGKGSLASYATNFSVTAAAGNPIKAAHYNETVGYIAKIKAISNYSNSKSAGDIIYALQAASDRLTTNANKGTTSTPTDCNSSCTGLCVDGCYTNCTGCSGSCDSGCKGACIDSCSRHCNSFCQVDGSSDCGDCSAGCQEKCRTFCLGAT